MTTQSKTDMLTTGEPQETVNEEQQYMIAMLMGINGWVAESRAFVVLDCAPETSELQRHLLDCHHSLVTPGNSEVDILERSVYQPKHC